jgi:hypothetical protein
MAQHEHGSMNTDAQEKTFASFVTLTTRLVIGIIITLILMAIVNG